MSDWSRISSEYLVSDEEFMQVRPSLIQSMNGDAVAALVLVRLMFRWNMFATPGPDGRMWWRCSIRDLSTLTGLTFDQVRRALDRLTKNGALVKVKRHEEGPSDQVCSYRPMGGMASTPNLLSTQEEETQEGEETARASGALDIRVPGVTGVASAVAAKKIARLNPEGLDVDAVFEAFWKVYPRKEAKKVARKAFERALTRAPKSVIASGLQRYLAALAADPSRPAAHAATWLNQERWNDEISVAPRRGRGSTTDERVAQGLDLVARLERETRGEMRLIEGGGSDERG